jgi:hypothetical protein
VLLLQDASGKGAFGFSEGRARNYVPPHHHKKKCGTSSTVREDTVSEKLATARRVLWLTVIAQSMEDLKAEKVTPGYFHTPDFIKVCALAEVTPESIRKRLNL